MFNIHNIGTSQLFSVYLVTGLNPLFLPSLPVILLKSTTASSLLRFLSLMSPSQTNTGTQNGYIIASYSDLSITLDIPSSNLRFFLVRWSLFLTCSVTGSTSISYQQTISFSFNNSLPRYCIWAWEQTKISHIFLFAMFCIF